MEDVLGKFVLKGLAKKALAGLFTKFPFLGWGPVGWFVTFLVDKYIDIFLSEVQKHMDINAVFAKNDKLRHEYDKSSVYLKIVADNHGEDSEEFKQGLKDAEEKFHDFIMLDIS